MVVLQQPTAQIGYLCRTNSNVKRTLVHIVLQAHSLPTPAHAASFQWHFGPADCANHSGTLVGKTADAEDRSAETVPSQRSLASATSLGQQSAAGTCPVAYFERQQADFARCGLHALNNALGGHIMTADDMSTACTEYLAEMHFEGNTYVVHTFFIIVQCVVCISFYFYSASYVTIQCLYVNI